SFHGRGRGGGGDKTEMLFGFRSPVHGESRASLRLAPGSCTLAGYSNAKFSPQRARRAQRKDRVCCLDSGGRSTVKVGPVCDWPLGSCTLAGYSNAKFFTAEAAEGAKLRPSCCLDSDRRSTFDTVNLSADALIGPVADWPYCATRRSVRGKEQMRR